ncbi:MAG: cytochrome b/b6 domain-containing protein [Burkholderiales bacterium]|nr:cytochrome b/b6 domain-containing protein [Burkholderiales bacterium]
MRVTTQKQWVLVWDLPVRVFHWLLVISFAGAWLTAESEAQQMLHYAFGYSACALILFRIVWGVIGTRYARFTHFIKGPTDTWHHIKLLFTGKSSLRFSSNLGHNPAGALAMISLIVLVLLIGITGYWIVKDYYGDFMSDAHETIANIALGVVIIHVLAAVIMSYMQKENLVKAMVTGKKQGTPSQAIRGPLNLVGIVLVLAWVYLMFVIYSGAIASITQ